MIDRNTHKKKASFNKLTTIYIALLISTLLTACNTSSASKPEDDNNNKPGGDLATNVKALNVETPEDRAKSIFLQDSVENIQRFSVTLDTQPENGELRNDNNLLYTYTPKLNFFGNDSFKFTVKDDQGSSVQRTVTIRVTPVNDAPVLITRNFNAIKNQTTELHLQATDIENDEISFIPASSTLLGATLNCNNAICSYTPPIGAIGQDSFSVTSVDINNATSTSTVTVNITSTLVNEKVQNFNQIKIPYNPVVSRIDTAHDIKLQVVAGDNAIQLSWETENNGLIKKIVRKQGDCSLNESDGTSVTDSVINNRLIDHDPTLINGVEYCYTVFINDSTHKLFPLTAVKVTPIISIARYPFSGANWNDYIQIDGTSINKLSDTACSADDLSREKTSCIHAGEIRQFEIPGLDSCDGITANDALGSFNWTCSESTFPVRIISTGLKNNKALSDLINFDTVKWRTNFVTISGNGFTYSSTPDVWWKNSISSVTATNIDTHQSLASQGTIYLLDPIDSAGNYAIDANNIGLLIKPGRTLTGATTHIYPSAAITLRAINNKSIRRSFLWIEGEINAFNNENGIYANNVSYAVFNNLVIFNAQENGLKMENTLNSYAKNIQIINTSDTTAGNDVVINNSKKIALSHIKTSDHSNCSVSITHSSNITLTSNTCHVSRTTNANVSPDWTDGSVIIQLN